MLLVQCNKQQCSLQVTELCVGETHSDMNNSVERRSALFSVSDCDATGTVRSSLLGKWAWGILQAWNCNVYGNI